MAKVEVTEGKLVVLIEEPTSYESCEADARSRWSTAAPDSSGHSKAATA